VAAALLVRGDERPFAALGRWAGSRALIGSEPIRVAGADEDPFAVLDDRPAMDERADGVVGGGWFGYLGYRLGRRLEPVGEGPPSRPVALPDAALGFYDHVLRLDAAGQWWFEALWTPARAAALDARLQELRRRASPDLTARPFGTTPWRSVPGAGGHALAVEACRERIAAGDLFQANLCVRLSSRLDGDALDLFAAAVAELGPDRAAYVAGPWGAVVSLSPELFLERHGRSVRSAPIKGTRPRPSDPRAAEAERRALESSEKDRAENVMIVDLVRNDLGRVCRPGSVRVPALAQARAHAGVWHLVSEVAGTLRDDVRDGDLVRAAFPPGSVTGAPKVAAMSVIAELESSDREVYTGAIGLASPVAGLELSVVIRTFEVRGEDIWLGVGGGVVADSDPVAEASEYATKAAPLLAAIGGALDAQAAAGSSAPVPLRLGPRPLPRPDPRAGVFETVLVVDGEPVALDLHLARLAASAVALYGRELPPSLTGEVRAACAGAGGRARLRLDLRPDGSTTIEVTALPARRADLRLRTVTVPGGLGVHKWADRRLVDALAAATAPDEPLVCDLDGNVLETTRANVVVVTADGTLVAPPVEARALPGTSRARVLHAARAAGLEVLVAPVDVDRLRRAEAILVTGALHGVAAAAACDDRPLDPEPEALARLRVGLGV
jgi:para-aminobenzoate synthetase/4-amino-4-deoxychorismate lyase